MHSPRHGELKLAGADPDPVEGRREIPGEQVARNPGMPLDLDLVLAQRVNRSAVERRAADAARRAARVKKAVAGGAGCCAPSLCIDLTTLNGDDTAGSVRRLCAKARASDPRPT